MKNNFGYLYVVPTPIGNMKDISLRAIDVLKSVDFILAEDSRNTINLLNKLEIKNKKVISYHKFNEKSREAEIIKNLKGGFSYALVSDAGTPLINDPGQVIVNECRKQDIEVVPISGASSLTMAISASGIKFETFTFIGYLEKTQIKIKNQIEKHKNSDLIVCFETPHRINKTLEFLENIFSPNKEIVVYREISKMYEEFYQKPIKDLKTLTFKGEIVLLIKL